MQDTFNSYSQNMEDIPSKFLVHISYFRPLIASVELQHGCTIP